MSVELTMPQLGESVTEGTVGRWLKAPGERVEKYEPLVEVETDKVTTEIPSPAAGTLSSIVTAEGATVPVGTVLAVIQPTTAEAQPGAVPAASTAATTEGAEATVGAPEASRSGNGQDAPTTIGTQEATTAPRQPHRYTPVVRKMAAEHGIDLRQIIGSGIGGRITKQDLLALLERGAPSTVPPIAASPIATLPEPIGLPGRGHPTAEPNDERIPLTAARRQIAERLARSTSEIPHAGGVVEVDLTELVRLRRQLQEEFERREAISLTYLPFVIKATVTALRQFPVLNSQWGGDCIILKRDINISIAVALEDSLMVPVIHRADGLSVAGIARAAASLAQRAREGRLRPDDVQGGTFTVNNTGALGTIQSRPIINYPQAAILTSEAIVQRPVIATDGSVVARWMMNMCISFDHRIMDGLVVSKFLKSIKQQLEDPEHLRLY